MSDQDNIFAKPFDDMAARIRDNAPDAFAGAFMIVLPRPGEQVPDVIKGTMFDVADPMAVLAVVQARIQAYIQDQTQTPQPFGQRR